MTTTPCLRWAAAAAIVLAPAGTFAKESVHSAGAGVRSAQSLPPVATPAYRAQGNSAQAIANAAASPPYCSGNKFGLFNGQGAAHGNGKPFTCGTSPG